MTATDGILLRYGVFQLTRSAGSVTLTFIPIPAGMISTHTLRGERDVVCFLCTLHLRISTHTLRGERDFCFSIYQMETICISTHTLRGERDCLLLPTHQDNGLFQLTRSAGSVTLALVTLPVTTDDFNSHAPRGA